MIFIHDPQSCAEIIFTAGGFSRGLTSQPGSWDVGESVAQVFLGNNLGNSQGNVVSEQKCTVF